MSGLTCTAASAAPDPRDLISFLRANERIAYGVGDLLTVKVIRPEAFGEREQAEPGELLDRWLSENPGADAAIE